MDREVRGLGSLTSRGALRDAEVRIATLEAKLAKAREALETIAKCEVSMNGHIARQAIGELDNG